MQHLNFYDFRNLRLAGCQVPATSGAIQRKHLVPIHCNEFKETFDNTTACGNTPPNVEMKPCEGLASIVRSGEDSRIDFEDPRLGHLHDGCDESKCFWVCIECRDRTQARYQHIGLLLDTVALCKIHSLEHEGSPSNACHCSNTVTGNWRCTMCILTGLDMIKRRAHEAWLGMPLHVTLLGVLKFNVRAHMNRACWFVCKLESAQKVLNKSTRRVLSTFGLRPREPPMFQWCIGCPIEDCGRAGWDDVRGMRMCLECKAVFPARDAIQ